MAASVANLNPFGSQGGAFGFGSGGSVQSAFSDAGGAVSDLFAAEGDKAEAQNYTLAAQLAGQNEQYTELSTSIKNTQADRQIYQTIGKQQAEVAGAGFSAGGSAGDLLRDSAAQGSLSHAVISEQGYITEQGYKEQQQSYKTMADAANNAALGSEIGGAIKGVAAVAQIAML
jgi:hypothetical protein